METAPPFSLVDQDQVTHQLSDYTGKWVILYFYPKDDTPGCTKEACSFRDAQALFEEKGVVVLGVSKDNPKSHKKFAEKYHLKFPLLSDESTQTIQAYGAWGPKKVMSKEYDGIIRSTVLISPTVEIAKRYPQVDPLKHVDELLADLATMQTV